MWRGDLPKAGVEGNVPGVVEWRGDLPKLGDSMPNEQGKNSRFLNLLQTFWTCYWTQMKIIKASFEPFW